jgi:hypothetical protein
MQTMSAVPGWRPFLPRPTAPDHGQDHREQHDALAAQRLAHQLPSDDEGHDPDRGQHFQNVHSTLLHAVVGFGERASGPAGTDRAVPFPALRS